MDCTKEQRLSSRTLTASRTGVIVDSKFLLVNEYLIIERMVLPAEGGVLVNLDLLVCTKKHFSLPLDTGFKSIIVYYVCGPLSRIFRR